MPLLLHSLPPSHQLRNSPLNGAWQRTSIVWPSDVTDSTQTREEVAEKRKAGVRKWTPWKRVDGWAIRSATYNQLGTIWTAHSEWTYDNPRTKTVCS